MKLRCVHMGRRERGAYKDLEGTHTFAVKQMFATKIAISFPIVLWSELFMKPQVPIIPQTSEAYVALAVLLSDGVRRTYFCGASCPLFPLS